MPHSIPALFYVAVAFVAMLLCMWLFDRTEHRYLDSDRPAVPERVPNLPTTLINICLAAVFLFLLAGTNQLVSDVTIGLSLLGFAVGAYRARIRPLYLAGTPPIRMLLLLVSIISWLLPLAWFIRLGLAKRYGAA